MANDRSTREIIEQARLAKDEDAYWRLIGDLHERGGTEEFQAANRLCRSDAAVDREIGADILGQLGWAKRHFQEESVTQLIALLADQVDDVVASAAYALGHRRAATAIPGLLALTEHPNPRVRHGVTFGLLALEEAEAITGLIRLSRDVDEEVRDWATFGLGSQIDADSPAIRQALADRLEEENEEIAGEALLGLARRGVPKAMDLVSAALQRDCLSGLVVQAAETLADPRLLPLLEVWRSRGDVSADGYFDKLLEDAWQACLRGKETSES